jgi:putative hemolysin
MPELLETVALWLPGVIAMAVLVVASGFFSGSETALFYLSRDDLRRMQTGGAGERLVASQMRNPDRLLTAILFWNLVINLTYFAVSLVTAKRLLDAEAATLAGLLSFFSLVGIILFGEVLPKSLAVVFGQRLAVLTSFPLAAATKLLDPVLPVLNATTRGLRRAWWPDLQLEPYLEVDDIERAVETSELGVELVRLEQQILGQILDMSDMKVEEVMRPRGTYQVLQPPVHLDQVRGGDEVPEYLLITGEDRDTVAKAIPLYDLNHIPERNLEQVAENVLYVPWCATVAETLSRLRASLGSVAGVINEYGETVGIVTEDDIIDTLLNPQSSRGKRLLEREPLVQMPTGEWIADGLTTLRVLASRLGFDYEPGEDGLLTIAALLHDQLERFPEVGDECLWEGYRITVTKAGGPGEAIQVSIHHDSPSF